MKYENMTKEEAERYVNDLYDLLYEEVNDEWVLKVEDETRRIYTDEEINKAKDDLNDLIDEVNDYIDGYDYAEMQEKEYRYMVEIESRYW